MCGIIGYIGRKQAVPIIINGLKRLEYRGYDSAGMAVMTNGVAEGGSDLQVIKRAGKVVDLEMLASIHPMKSTIGIGHTRWATHGEPTDLNAHPHMDHTGSIALIHNGIIENYGAIRKKLERNGTVFTSDTDTE